MAENAETAAVETSDDSNTEVAATETATGDAAATGEAALGDAGKKALDAMKAERKAARDEAAAEKARADALQAKLEGKEAEHAAALKAREAELAALAKADEKILKAEIRATAASKLADPADALRFLDLSAFEVSADGEVDASLIASAIDDLIKTKPYLAAQGGQRFQGSADGGARNDSTKVSQLSEADMARMTPEQIAAADEKGQFDALRGR